jgi:hypothetical protein
MDCGDEKHDVQAFLDEIKTTRPNDYYQLVSLLDRTSKYGVVYNEPKTKPLQGNHAKPLWEFCAKKCSRVFWFLDQNDKSVLVCTHAFIAKGKHDHRPEIERAQKRRSLYYQRPRIGYGL